jgi:NAD(P)H-hydrate repair Nnr-like enzyme with NAD(P)H-hydrate dehydratase domain
MKKLILLALIAAAVSSTSCRKERTCECVTTETTVATGMGAGTETEISSYKETIAKQRKKEFIIKTDCISTRDVRTNSNPARTEVITTETKCELK